MTPRHAIELTKRGETAEFFSAVAQGSVPEDVRTTANPFAQEELEHIRLRDSRPTRALQPKLNWREDVDPPIPQK